MSVASRTCKPRVAHAQAVAPRRKPDEKDEHRRAIDALQRAIDATAEDPNDPGKRETLRAAAEREREARARAKPKRRE